jgi:hypothetical protein
MRVFEVEGSVVFSSLRIGSGFFAAAKGSATWANCVPAGGLCELKGAIRAA